MNIKEVQISQLRSIVIMWSGDGQDQTILVCEGQSVMKSKVATSAKRVTIVFIRSALFFLLWWALTEGEGGDWIALPVVLLATGATLALSPAGTGHWRAAGLFGFVSFFLRESLRGGIDVARRALHTRLL